MENRTAFGKRIEKKLVDLDKNQEWLMEQIRAKTGLYVDSSYMYKIKTGKCSTPSIVNAICDVLGIKA